MILPKVHTKKISLSLDLNIATDSACLMASSSLFHSCGPAMEKDLVQELSPNLVGAEIFSGGYSMWIISHSCSSGHRERCDTKCDPVHACRYVL